MVDITVRGAGIFGLSVAWACAKRGTTVQVVDPFGPGAGSSGGLVGALAPHVPENWNDKKAFQLDSLLMMQTWWAEVADAGGVDPGYARAGRLQPIADDRALALAHDRALGAQSLWRKQADWRIVAREDLGDWAPDSLTRYLIHDTLSARIHPKQACDALVAALTACGVPILPAGDDRGQVVWATGWQGLRDLSAVFGKSVGTGVKGQSLALRYDVGHMPQIFVDGLHIVPHGNGTVAIGSTSERDFEHPSDTDAQCDALLDRAIAAMPVLRNAPVIARWAGVRPRARSRAPMLGAWPNRPGHFIANGGFKIGFGMAPKVASVMADLLLDQRDSIPDGFRVARSF